MLAYGQSQGKGGESTVRSVIERRAEIMRVLVARRKETAPRLAKEFGVCVNTIRNDVLALTVD